MPREDIVQALAPCGLYCGKCLANPESPICGHARGLVRELAGFDRHADRFAKINPVFAGYQGFKTILTLLTRGTCRGCRQGQGMFAACKVAPCAADKGVDFCFQCQSFPCRDHGFPRDMADRWKSANRAMAEMGVEEFFAAIRDEPRYG
jgi:hypothetical protein